MRTVIVTKPDGTKEEFANAYLQADDRYVLIRQAFPDQPKAFTTTAIFSPGQYLEARYDQETMSKAGAFNHVPVL